MRASPRLTWTNESGELWTKSHLKVVEILQYCLLVSPDLSPPVEGGGQGVALGAAGARVGAGPGGDEGPHDPVQLLGGHGRRGHLEAGVECGEVDLISVLIPPVDQHGLEPVAPQDL